MSADFSDEHQNDSPSLVTTDGAPDEKSLSYFQSLLGMIMFVVRTRPDIAFAVNRLAVRTAKATEKDLKALRRIASYLYGSRNWELVYSKGSGSPDLYAYSDASFVTHPDGKSHMGFCIGYGSNSGFFFSRSAKQKLVKHRSFFNGKIAVAIFFAQQHTHNNTQFFPSVIKRLYIRSALLLTLLVRSTMTLNNLLIIYLITEHVVVA